MAKKIGISVLIAIVLIIGLAFWYVNYVFIPQKLKPMLVDGLEKALDKKVAISQAQYFPFKGVTLSGIDIRDRDNTPFVTIKNVDLRLKSWPRLKPNDFQASGQLVVQEFSFNQQTIIASGNARIALDAALKGKNKPAFTVGITLENAAVRGIPSAPDILNINGTLHATESTFNTADLAAVIQDLPLRVSAAGAYTPQDVTIEQAELTYADQTKLSARGAIKNISKPAADLTFNAHVELADIHTLLSAQDLPAMKGAVVLQGGVRGSLTDMADLSANVTVTAPEVQVDKLRITELNTLASLSQGTVLCESCTFRLYEGTGKISAQAQITDAMLPVDVTADVEGIHLLPLIMDMIGQDVGAGNVNAHLAVKGPALNQLALNGSGWFTLTDGKVQIPSRFDRVAKTLQINQMEYMVINDASATFTIREAKVDSQDIVVNADMANINGSGFVGFDQSVDVELLVRLTPSAVESAGGIGNLSQFVSDKSGLPLTKIKIYGRMPDALKHRIIPMPVEDIFKEAVPQALEAVIKGENTSPEIKQQIEKGMDALKGIFQKN